MLLQVEAACVYVMGMSRGASTATTNEDTIYAALQAAVLAGAGGCAPGYTPVTLINTHAERPTFLFMADESPLHRKLGVYEVRN